MAQGHERYEELALEHVLGGLTSSDAAIFRAHLVECRDCRLRVAELRDLAAELAATEREERRRAAVATQVAHRREPSEEPRSWLPWSSPRWALLGATLVLVVFVAVLFWNYQLRRVNGEYANVLRQDAKVLEILGVGRDVPVQGRDGTRGVAALRGAELALDLLQIPTFPQAQIVVWRVQPDGTAKIIQQESSMWASQPLRLVVEVASFDMVLVTVEGLGQLPPLPSGRQLARIDVPAGSLLAPHA